MKFTTTASSVDSTGSISVQYNNLTATANVVCTIVYNTSILQVNRKWNEVV